MKNLKRILALMTALVLCLAPMALMIGAAEHGVTPRAVLDVTCVSCGSTNAVYLPSDEVVLYFAEYATPIYCYYEAYLLGRVSCLTCGTINPDLYVNSSQHPTIMYNEDRTRRFCTACGLEEYGGYFGK